VAELEHSLQKHLAATHAIQSEITGGGMSRVFVAEDLALSRRVVIKVLNPTLAATVSVARFQREIMLVARLNHPNIVPVLTAGEIETLPYFIMPFIDGESLRGRMVRGPLSIRETVMILKDVARALAYAHSAGIVHRDIKPDNILVTGSAAVVTDFGVAKAVSAARDKRVTSGGESITGIGISLGTPQYMAPEQAAADPNADLRVDLYALGIVAYEMLVGSPPFHGRTPQKLLAAQLTELPPPLASRRGDIPKALADLVMQCLEKDPADRPKNAASVLRDLEDPDAVSGPVAALPGGDARQRMRRFKETATGAIPALIVAALLVWGLWPDRTPSTSPLTAQNARAAPRVRVPPATAIGAQSADVAKAFTAAVETGIVRFGYQVTSAAEAAPSDSTGVAVELTVQRSGERARTNVRLVRGSGNATLWSDQVDFRVQDSFAAQDTITARVLRALPAAFPPALP
jgi:eukaryotic-like serine/threonine-protein kinase